jgi:glycosyltransferase involved in cell wall biosynthesis
VSSGTGHDPARGKLGVMALVDAVGVSGGGERFARHLTMRLNGDRFDRYLCVTRWSPELAANPDTRAALDELREAGVAFVGLRRRSVASLAAWRPVLRMLRGGRIQILHTHKFGANAWGGLLSLAARPPVLVAHEQTWSYEGRPIRRLIDRELVARRADAFVCVSSEDRRRMIEVERIDPRKIVLVPNAIPGAAPVGHDVRRELAIESDAPVVGAVCVLRPQKALDVLLRAGALVKAEYPRLRIVIAGDGPERERLEAQATSLGLGETVRFLGFRSDVPDVLGALDVAVSCSDFEGTPLAVMEYMEAGRPIVATRVGGVPDLIETGVHGLLVPPRDEAGLAAAIGRLLDDRDAARQMAERARQRRRAEFDIEAAARRMESLYEELYERAVAGRGRDG